MDLGYLADFFEFVFASGPQPPGCRPETSTNSKKSAKWIHFSITNDTNIF